MVTDHIHLPVICVLCSSCDIQKENAKVRAADDNGVSVFPKGNVCYFRSHPSDEIIPFLSDFFSIWPPV